MRMASFKQSLCASGQKVLDTRARMVFERTKMAEDMFLAQCKNEVLVLMGEIARLKDLSVKTTVDLNPTGDSFDAADWVKKRHELERKLRVAKINYAMAMKVDQEEFPKEDSVEDIDLSDIQEEFPDLKLQK